MNTTTVTAIQPEFAAANDTKNIQAAPIDTQPECFDQGAANSFAIGSFVLGLVSVVAGWSFVAPIVGLVLGILALRRGTGERTLALWGVWLNGVLLALSALAILLVAFVVGFGFIMLPFAA